MIIRIIPRVKGEDDYPDEVNVLSNKSLFCCDELHSRLQCEFDLIYSTDYIYLGSQFCKYCPYCGQKIFIKQIETQYKKEYEELVRKQEEERLERISNLPPRSKYWIKKTKKQAKQEYEKVFKQYE